MINFALALMFAGGGGSPFMPRENESPIQFCQRAGNTLRTGGILLFKDGLTEGLAIIAGEPFELFIIFPKKDGRAPISCKDTAALDLIS